MKKNVLILGAMFALMACGVNPHTEERAQAVEDSVMEIVKRNDHQIDSVKQRSADIMDLINAGYEPDRAVILIDSTYKVASTVCK